MVLLIQKAQTTTIQRLDSFSVVYHVIHILTIEKTYIILNWLKSWRDMQAGTRIQVRIDRLALGNASDAKLVGAGVKT
jgi:hypothetical protein